MPLPSIAAPDVAALARLLREAGLSEISVETTPSDAAQPASRVLVRRATPASHATLTGAAPSSESVGLDLPLSLPEIETLEVGADAVPDAVTLEVLSPAVGLFREADPPLQAGDEVAKGQVLGAVESLKVPNEIRAPAGGFLTAVTVQADQGVEYGQLLFAMIESNVEPKP